MKPPIGWFIGVFSCLLPWLWTLLSPGVAGQRGTGGHEARAVLHQQAQAGPRRSFLRGCAFGFGETHLFSFFFGGGAGSDRKPSNWWDPLWGPLKFFPSWVHSLIPLLVVSVPSCVYSLILLLVVSFMGKPGFIPFLIP